MILIPWYGESVDTEVESKSVSSSMIVTKSFYLLDKIATRKKKKREREREREITAIRQKQAWCFAFSLSFEYN